MRKLFALFVCLTMVASASVASAQSLSTLFGTNNGGADGGAVYFDLTVGPNDLNITGFDTNTADTGTNFFMDVYAVVGTFAGNEATAAFWGASVDTVSGTTAGTDNPSNATGAGFTLLAGNTYAMALVMDPLNNHQYTNGTGANQNYANADMSLTLGSASNTPFATPTFNPRVWNGTVYYQSSAIPEPASLSILACGALGLVARRRRRS